MRRTYQNNYSIEQGSYTPGGKKGRALRAFKKMVISLVVLIVVFVVAGFVYAFINNQSGKEPSEPKAAAVDPSPYTAKPAKPADNAPEGVAVYLEAPTVKAGANISITARTNPTSNCVITATYNGVASKDSGLTPKIANEYGTVNWSWTVEPTVPVGTWPVRVTCVYHGRTGVAEAKLQVTK